MLDSTGSLSSSHVRLSGRAIKSVPQRHSRMAPQGGREAHQSRAARTYQLAHRMTQKPHSPRQPGRDRPHLEPGRQRVAQPVAQEGGQGVAAVPFRAGAVCPGPVVAHVVHHAVVEVVHACVRACVAAAVAAAVVVGCGGVGWGSLSAGAA